MYFLTRKRRYDLNVILSQCSIYMKHCGVNHKSLNLSVIVHSFRIVQKCQKIESSDLDSLSRPFLSFPFSFLLRVVPKSERARVGWKINAW